MFKRVTTIALAIMLTASMAFGSGFSIYEHGAKATAMGGAFIAQANDPSAVFYNPAGITSLKGTQFGLGATVIMPTFSFTGPDGPLSEVTDAEELQFYIPHVYATHQLNDQWSVGFGFYALYGLTSEWPEEWVGREFNIKTALKTLWFNPQVAFKPIENLSLSAGVSYVSGSVDMNYDMIVAAGPTYGRVKLEGSSSAWAFDFGLQWKAMEALTLGARYRTGVDFKLEDGDVSVDILGNIASSKGSATLNLPSMIGFGLAYDITESFTAEIDWMQLAWSSYDKLVLTVDPPLMGQTEIESDKNYEDSYSIRLGLEYRLNESWAIRGGYLRDNKAVPDAWVEPTLPEGDRDLISLGFGWTNQSWTVDGYFLILKQADRQITNSEHDILGGMFDFNGLYKGSATLFGVTLGYAIN